VDALQKLGFHGSGSYFRRITARSIEIIRISKKCFFRVDLYVARPRSGSCSAAEDANRALMTRYGGGSRCIVDIIYATEIVPLTAAGAEDLANRKLRALKRTWLPWAAKVSGTWHSSAKK
jgi:hypothetical protein